MENISQIRRIVETLDLSEIQDILNEMRRKSGLLDKIRLPPISYSKISYFRLLIGKYFKKEFTLWESFILWNTITLYWHGRQVKGEQDNEEKIAEIVFTLMHEFTHSFWYASDVLTAMNNRLALLMTRESWFWMQSGFNRIHLEKWKGGISPRSQLSYLEGLSEGMTDVIALEVMQEYCKRKWLPIKPPVNSKNYYHRERITIKNFVDYLSKAWYWDSEILKNSLIQWYFSGLNIVWTLWNTEYWLWLSQEDILKLLWENNEPVRSH